MCDAPPWRWELSKGSKLWGGWEVLRRQWGWGSVRPGRIRWWDWGSKEERPRIEGESRILDNTAHNNKHWETECIILHEYNGQFWNHWKSCGCPVSLWTQKCSGHISEREVGYKTIPQAGINIAGRNNSLRYANDTTLLAEREEELKSLLMKVKEKSEKKLA